MKTWNDANEIINNMVDNLITSFENDTPREIMKTTISKDYMYNASVRLLVRLCGVLNISREKLDQHLNLVWNGEEPKVLN